MNDQVDMAQFIEARSDQLNSDDLIGRTLTITVTKVTGADGDQPVSIHYQGDNGKPFKPCKTIRRVLVAIWGRYANDYVGRSMTVYRDDKVTFGGLEVGGIRISHMSHLDKETIVVVAKSKGKKAGMKILPLAATAGKPGAKNPAETWTAGYIERLEAMNNLTDVLAFATEKEGKLAELQAKRPDLWQRATTALATAKAKHADVFSDDSFDETGEVLTGKDDADTGDGFTDDDQPLAVKTAGEIKGQMEGAQDEQTYNVVLAEWNKHRGAIEAYDEALAVSVNNAVLIAAQRLGI